MPEALSREVQAQRRSVVALYTQCRLNTPIRTASVSPALPFFTARVPLRDGSTLAADVFTPSPDTPRPLVLEVTPYGRGPDGINFRSEAPFWLSRGYAMVIVDCRGKGDSQGAFEAFVHERADGFDIIEWLAVQPFCDGRIGMRGSSYTGTNPWFAALDQPPHLSAISPSASTANMRDEITWLGGIFSFEHSLTWGSRSREGHPVLPPDLDWNALLNHRPMLTVDERLLGTASPGFRQLAAYFRADGAPHPQSFEAAEHARIAVPSLAFTGWQDGCLAGTLAHFQAARLHGAARDQQHLVVGPWDHMGAPDGGHDFRTGQPMSPLGDMAIPAHGFVPAREWICAFFDHHLKGEPAFKGPHARLFLTGSNRWIEADDYPPAADRRRLYLHSGGGANGLRGDGTLGWSTPGDETPDEYLHDPLHPVPSRLPDATGAMRTLREWPRDLGPLLDRADMLVYASLPLPEDLSVAGNVIVHLVVASDALDADFYCRLEDVGPDGRGMRLGSHGAARRRLRARHGPQGAEEPYVPGTAVELMLDLGGIGHTFLVGHRLRLSVCSSAYPETFPNPGTGQPVTTNTAEPRLARQRVYHDHSRPSWLELPVLPLNAFQP